MCDFNSSLEKEGLWLPLSAKTKIPPNLPLSFCLLAQMPEAQNSSTFMCRLKLCIRQSLFANVKLVAMLASHSPKPTEIE